MNPLRKPSLFVIDDDPDQVYVIELAARRSGEFGQIWTAVDSQLAYHLLLENVRSPALRPDLILIDWKMPRMHGSELAAALSAHPYFRDIPVVALSTSGYEADRRLAIEAGCKTLCQKPGSFEQLVTLLTDIKHAYCEKANVAGTAREDS